MRTADLTQHTLYNYRNLDDRIPAEHPLRKFRILVEGILQSMSAEIDRLYSRGARK